MLLFKVLSLLWFVCTKLSTGYQLVDTLDYNDLNNTENAKGMDESSFDCDRYRGKVISNETQAILCCNSTYMRFTSTWHNEAHYLTEFLETLKVWDCPQFVSECSNTTFFFNRFTQLVYERACNSTKFQKSCLATLVEIAEKREEKQKTASTQWETLLTDLRSFYLEDEELSNPCVQVSLYDAVTEERGDSFGYFHEIIRVFIPFCELIWCGVDAQTVHDRVISPWLCMPFKCKINVILIMVTCGLLSVINIIMNITIIVVMIRYKQLRNSQGIYRLSLAFGDLIVGAIIYPTFANSLAKITRGQESMGPAVNQTIINVNASFDSVPHLPGGSVWIHFDQPYLFFVGFFTSMYLTVTVFSLCMACIDRFALLRKSISRSHEGAKRLAIIAVVVLWVVSVIIAVVPFFVAKYNLIASVAVLASGSSSIYLYLIAFVLPILTMWGVSLATCCLRMKRKMTKRNSSSETDVSQQLIEEDRQTFTLSVMVSTFSACLVIGCISAASSFFLEDIDYSNPYSLNTQNASIFVSLELVAIMFLVCNSVCNFTTYFSRDSQFRIHVLQIYRGCCKKKENVKSSYQLTTSPPTKDKQEGDTLGTSMPVAAIF